MKIIRNEEGKPKGNDVAYFSKVETSIVNRFQTCNDVPDGYVENTLGFILGKQERKGLSYGEAD